MEQSRVGEGKISFIGRLGRNGRGQWLMWPGLVALSQCENKEEEVDALLAGEILGTKWLWGCGTRCLQRSQL